MNNGLKVSFGKFHGLGNDFIVAASRGLPQTPDRLARAICHRRTGIGADGFLMVSPAKSRRHDAQVRFFNADGSEAEMSGNGIRCVAAFLMSRGTGTRSSRKKGLLQIETVAGVKRLEAVAAEQNHWVFRVGMGLPILKPEKIPFLGGNPTVPVVRFPLQTAQGAREVTVTSMGNPHCTLFVSNFGFDWFALGREIERHRCFPNRTNVEFVRIISREEIEVRFWERGVGVTQSSGTGSCGAVVASILNALTSRNVRVHTAAGELKVAWPEEGEVLLTGPVERIAKGDYYTDPS